MRVTFCLFGYLRERAGVSRLEMQLPAGATVAQAVEALAREKALDVPLLKSARPAVNHEYCEYGQVLSEGDEVALIPPVSGG